MRHLKQNIKLFFLYLMMLSLLVPGRYIMAEEAEEGDAIRAEESANEEEILAEEEHISEETPVSEEEIEVDEVSADPEENIEDNDPEEDAADVIEIEEPAEESVAIEHEAQVTEVASAEEAAAALADLQESDPESRLIVFGDSLPEDTAASEIIYYEEYNEYILQFSSPEDAAQAQEDLAEEYDVFEDDILTLDNLLDDEEGDPESYSWGTTVMGVDPYLNGIPATDEITVAVIDSGVDPGNPFFPEGVIRSDSRDLTMSDNVLTDMNGHGTHVCGIIADMTPDQVHILALRVYDDEGKTSWGLILTALQYCMENDVDVINISLGANNVSSAPLDTILEQAKNEGIVVVCAAGNDARPVMYPARLDSTIAVSAIKDTFEIWPSSNYGDEVDFCAPGYQIRSAARSLIEVTTTTKSGTSMASPHMAAVFAYLKLAYPGASWDTLYAEAKAWSIDLGPVGWDEEFGWGYPELTGLFNEPYAIEDCEISLDQTVYFYNGSVRKPNVTLTYNGRTLVKENEYTVSYSNDISIGEGTVTITGQRRFSGSITRTFEILPTPLEKCNVSLSQTSYIYTGDIFKPEVTVEYDGDVLVEDLDYNVIYEDKSLIGEVTVTIIGMGNCEGTILKSFEILPISMEKCNASLNQTSYTYDGKAKKPAATVTFNSKTLVKNTDYTVSYKSNTAIGYGTVTITGKGNYTGSITKTFTIKPAALKSCKATLSQTSYTYDGKAKKPAVTVVFNSKTLVKNTDYTVSYTNNTAIGYGTVTITGKGNFTGSISKTFKILPAKVTILTPAAGTKKMTVKYKTVKGSCRYQINYRIKGTTAWTKVNTTAQTSKTIKKLKSKKIYQVRIRAYKIVEGKAIKGPWSDIKTVKVK